MPKDQAVGLRSRQQSSAGLKSMQQAPSPGRRAKVQAVGLRFILKAYPGSMPKVQLAGQGQGSRPKGQTVGLRSRQEFCVQAVGLMSRQ